jgi:hypothetical protein
MIAHLRAVTLFALVCIVVGCTGVSSVRPGDAAQSVRDRAGAPATVWKNPDGSELWQYPLGYYATQTFVVTVGADQRVQEVNQVLSEPYFTRIQAGMSREDVHRVLGRPREVWYFPARDEEVWTWRYYDTAYMFFNVLFDRSNDKVRSVQRLEEPPTPSGGTRN